MTSQQPNQPSQLPLVPPNSSILGAPPVSSNVGENSASSSLSSQEHDGRMKRPYDGQSQQPSQPFTYSVSKEIESFAQIEDHVSLV